jgi:uncharacterized membrane protein SirB2
MENEYFHGFPHHSKCRKKIWNLEESLNIMRGTKIVEKTRVSPPKTGKQWFSAKVVVTIRFYTLEIVVKKIKILEKG